MSYPEARSPAEFGQFGHVAPPHHPDKARTLLCPLLSIMREDGTLQRVNCMAGECTLWDWLLPPHDGYAGLAPHRGLGKCSLPRRAYMIARREAQQFKRAAAP